MKTIYLGRQTQLYTYLDTVLATEFASQLNSIDSITKEEFKTTCASKKPSLIIHATSLQGIDNFELLKIAFEKHIPVLLICFKEDLGKFTAFHQDPRYHVFPVTGDDDNMAALSHTIARLLDISHRSENRTQYLPADITSLVINLKIPVNIYVKLEDKKYVLIFKKGHEFSRDEILATLKKYPNALYLTKYDYKELAKLHSQKMSEFLSSKRKNLNSIRRIASSALEMGRNLYLNFGLKQAALDQTNLYSEAAFSILAQKPTLIALLSNYLNQDNFLTRHSLLTGLVCCLVADDLEYSSEYTVQSFLLAAYFHDITLEDDRYEGNSNDAFVEEKVINDDEYLNFFHHPKKSADLLDDIEGIPPATKHIIMQHHETVDGTGFPSKLNHKNIHGASALFIVCHDFVESLFRIDGPKRDEIILSTLEEKYQKPAFSKIVSALKNII